MAQSTKKQATGKRGTHEKTSTASGICRQDSSTSSWLKALQIEQVSSLEAPSAEWKTRGDLESIFHLKRARMNECLLQMKLENKVESKTFIVMTSNVLRHIPHYRLK